MGEQPTRITGDGSQYVGKRLLVGISYEDPDGELLRQEQFHGPIVAASENGILLERSDTGERVSLPPQLTPAPPGEYRLRSTGQVVVDPDYLARWVRKDPPSGGVDNEA